ncbi:MAG: hypothetical protein ABJE66_14980 [Deltaproteobacteria bacterium]
MRKLLFLVALTLLPTPADASCAYVGMTPNVLTRRDTKLPADGGVLVGYTYGNDNDGEASGADPSDVKWSATNGKAKVTLTRTELAPGLSVYRPPVTVSAFKLVGKTKEHGSYTHEATSAPTAIAAPVAKAIKSKTTEGFRSMTTTTMLKLSTAAPAEAVAIIAYDDTGKALLYATLADTHDKILDFEIQETGGHCGTPRPTGEGSLVGKITFAYVDAFGRLSPKSKPVTAR